jgi:signal peptidase I
MLPSIAPGDWLLLGPGSPSPGKVFVVHDPTEPGRDVLRRVVGVAGHKVRVAEGQLEVDGARARIREMGRDGQHLVLSENNAWLIRRRLQTSRLQPEPSVVPKDAVWVLADARDLASDSRWWGSVSTALLGRQVWLRLGEPNEWRSRLSWHAMDGPWFVPPPS